MIYGMHKDQLIEDAKFEILYRAILLNKTDEASVQAFNDLLSSYRNLKYPQNQKELERFEELATQKFDKFKNRKYIGKDPKEIEWPNEKSRINL